MANIHIKQQHDLTHDEARKRVEEIARDLRKKLNVDYHWEGDFLRFQRSGASGSIAVGSDFIELKVKLGMVLAPMKGKIEQSIRQNLHLALGEDKDQSKPA
jgi:putative polyhydroxyalkanoate system protein